MFDASAVRERLEARFAPGWPRSVAVPEAWLPRLAELDAELAALDPDYQLAQVKTKFGGLRYYVEEPFWLPCCAAWHAAHPLPDDADEAAEAGWDAAGEAHDDSPEHVSAHRTREAVVERMSTLVQAAEGASYGW
jgi:hypothetical protein